MTLRRTIFSMNTLIAQILKKTHISSQNSYPKQVQTNTMIAYKGFFNLKFYHPTSIRQRRRIILQSHSMVRYLILLPNHLLGSIHCSKSVSGTLIGSFSIAVFDVMQHFLKASLLSRRVIWHSCWYSNIFYAYFLAGISKVLSAIVGLNSNLLNLTTMPIVDCFMTIGTV